jgi:hypothetical protein
MDAENTIHTKAPHTDAPVRHGNGDTTFSHERPPPARHARRVDTAPWGGLRSHDTPQH